MAKCAIEECVFPAEEEWAPYCTRECGDLSEAQSAVDAIKEPKDRERCHNCHHYRAWHMDDGEGLACAAGDDSNYCDCVAYESPYVSATPAPPAGE